MEMFFICLIVAQSCVILYTCVILKKTLRGLKDLQQDLKNLRRITGNDLRILERSIYEMEHNNIRKE